MTKEEFTAKMKHARDHALSTYCERGLMSARERLRAAERVIIELLDSLDYIEGGNIYARIIEAEIGLYGYDQPDNEYYDGPLEK